MIYEHRATVVVASGSAASTTLKIHSGIMHQLLIRANTGTTVFRANLQDENGLIRANWGFHEGELNDTDKRIPLCGEYIIQVTNASLTDTLTIVLAADERGA